MIAVSKFVFFNTILPAVDIGTDLHAYLIYSAYYDDDLDNYHPKWAGLTLSWMFAPFTIHVGKFFYRTAIKRGVKWLSLDGWRYGIKHVVEEPKMLELLQVWSSADENSREEAEMRVRDKFKDNFKVLTITLPAAMESQEKEEVQEIVRRWNSNHATKCE